MTDTPSPAATEAAKRFPDRPINLPEGPAVVVPVPERKAFIAGAAWQASQVLAVLEPFARKADAVSLGDALGHIERAHLMATRDLVAHLRRAPHSGEDEARHQPLCNSFAVVDANRQRDEALESAQLWRQNWDELYQEVERLKRERDRYKALAEGERERIATMFEDIEEERAARHVRKFSAPSLEETPDKEPSDV